MATILISNLVVVAAFDWTTMMPPLAMAGALLVGAAVVALFRRWQRTEKPLSPSPSDQLAEFRSLYEKGILSEEEFKRLRDVLGEEIRQAHQLPEPHSETQSANHNPAQPLPSETPPPQQEPPSETGIRPA